MTEMLFDAPDRKRPFALNHLAAVRTGLSAREKDDFYATPAKCTRALLNVEAFDGAVWEPACGDGAISKALPGEVISTDLVDRGFGISRRDFLMEQELLAPNVITNPPFKLADEFVLHALHLGARKVAIFMRLAWLEGRARHERLWKPHPPVRVWTFCGRQTLWRGDDPNAKETGGAIAFGWFVWEAGHQGPYAGGWLP
jgi:hypothetical protein